MMAEEETTDPRADDDLCTFQVWTHESSLVQLPRSYVRAWWWIEAAAKSLSSRLETISLFLHERRMSLGRELTEEEAALAEISEAFPIVLCVEQVLDAAPKACGEGYVYTGGGPRLVLAQISPERPEIKGGGVVFGIGSVWMAYEPRRSAEALRLLQDAWLACRLASAEFYGADLSSSPSFCAFSVSLAEWCEQADAFISEDAESRLRRPEVIAEQVADAKRLAGQLPPTPPELSEIPRCVRLACLPDETPMLDEGNEWCGVRGGNFEDPTNIRALGIVTDDRGTYRLGEPHKTVCGPFSVPDGSVPCPGCDYVDCPSNNP